MEVVMKKGDKRAVSFASMLVMLLTFSHGILFAETPGSDPAKILLNRVLDQHKCTPPNNKDYAAAHNELTNYLSAIGVNTIRDPHFTVVSQGLFRRSLHRAAAQGLKSLIKILLECGLSIDMQDAIKNTPLHTALTHGKSEAAQLLIESGASLDSRNWLGEAPLHVASKIGNFELVHFLLEGGADANVQDGNGNTPAHFAANKETIARLTASLIEHNQPIAPENRRGETPLTTALNSYITSKKASLPGVIGFLIQFGVPLSDNDIEQLNSLFINWQTSWLKPSEEKIRQELEPYLDPTDLRRLIGEFIVSSPSKI